MRNHIGRNFDVMKTLLKKSIENVEKEMNDTQVRRSICG
jgi:hypothetical protein